MKEFIKRIMVIIKEIIKIVIIYIVMRKILYIYDDVYKKIDIFEILIYSFFQFAAMIFLFAFLNVKRNSKIVFLSITTIFMMIVCIDYVIFGDIMCILNPTIPESISHFSAYMSMPFAGVFYFMVYYKIKFSIPIVVISMFVIGFISIVTSDYIRTKILKK